MQSPRQRHPDDTESPSRSMTAPSQGRVFLRTIVVLLAGTTVSQVVIVSATPLLTRLYTPSDFGLAAIYVSAVSVLGVIGALRYDIAIPVARDEETGHALVAAAFAASLLIGLSLGALLIASGSALLAIVNAEALTPFLWLFPLGVTVTGIQQTMTYWALRSGSAGSISRSRVAQSGALVSGQLAAGAYDAGALGLIASHPIGRVVGSGLLAPFIPWRRMRALSVRTVLTVANSYRRFPLFTAWSGLINALGLQAPVILLSAIYGTPVAGAFFLTMRVLQAPAALAGQAVAQAFFSHASRSNRVSDRSQYATQAYEGMLILAAGPALVVVATGRAGFGWVFGPEWSVAGEYAAWLAPWTLLVFAASPVSTGVLLTNRQGTELALQIGLLILRSAALIAGAALGGPGTSVALFGVVSFLAWVPYAIWLLSLSGVPAASAARATIRSLAMGTFVAAPFGLAVTFTLSVPMVVAMGLVSSVLYVLNLRSGLSRLNSAGV